MPIAELPRASYALVEPLFAELDHHLSAAAVLAGSMPGQVLADSAQAPAAALISSPEGCYLAAGEPQAALDFGRAALARILAAWPEISLFVAPGWEPHVAALCAGLSYATHPRRRYRLGRLSGGWHLPASLSLARLDAAILGRPDLREHHIVRWARGNWGSTEKFLSGGFGFAVFAGEQPASWCLADSAVGERCEVGIHTHPDQRRRGLAAAVVAATVDYALGQGFTEVGWHCGEENLGSQGVAEKVGFKLTHRFQVIDCRNKEGEKL